MYLGTYYSKSEIKIGESLTKMESEDQDAELAIENIYRQEFELLKDMFEEHFSSEVIAGVLEDCGGDVNLAVDTLTKIESSISTVTITPDNPTSQTERTVTECNNSNMASTNISTSLNAPSYAAASQTLVTASLKPHAIRRPPRSKNVMPRIDYWSDEMRNIIRYHNIGCRFMVVMRGAPGSGKTYLARVIVESTVGTSNPNSYENHIFSADDHMQKNGKYHYDVTRLEEVHMKNQTQVHVAVNEGRSPVIVDNTNMTTWEIYPFVRDAVKNGYIIEVVEPSNPWSHIPSQLAKRNIHGVPKDKIQKMLQKYEGTFTGESLLKYLNLFYPKGMEPPVERNVPVFNKKIPRVLDVSKKLESFTETNVNQINEVPQNRDSASVNQNLEDLPNDSPYINESLNVNHILHVVEPNIRDDQLQQNIIEANNNIDEMLMLEVERDNGEGREPVLSNPEPTLDAVASSSIPKQRRSEANERPNKFIEPLMLNDDWTKNLMFMQPTQSDTASALKEPAQIQVQTEASGTLVELGDKSMITISNDINEVPSKDKTLNQLVLNNTTTAHATFSGFHTCDQENQCFINMRKMFKNIPRPVLREIYDNCAGDGNWACAIVLDGIKNNTIQTINTDISDSEEEVHVECQCEERNNTVPAISSETSLTLSDEKQTPSAMPAFKKKAKKEKTELTEESSQVLQTIKKSVKISENHYSQHHLNLRKARYDSKGNYDEKASNINENPDTNDANSSLNVELGKATTSAESSFTPLPDSISEPNALPDISQNVLYRDIPSTSAASAYYAVPSTSDSNDLEPTDADDEYEDDDDNNNDNDNDDDDNIGSDDDKSVRHVTVIIGMEFVRNLDKLYGRHNFEYPEGVQPTLTIPKKILQVLNALWMETVVYQLDKVHTQTDEMIKQDEEFARQVELKMLLEAEEAETSPEEENAKALPEPIKPQEPPNFKEIMDTDLALAIYEKEVKEEWKNKEPQDMAAQMTRKKLYELFPDVAKETLSEMLIAHENNFDATVEILLISTGQGHYLDHSNGINKFVIEKEKENKGKLMLAEQNAALNDLEYPYPMKPGKEQEELTMETVDKMRLKAEKHKNARDMFFLKAKWYYERKKFAEASYYSRIAALHTTQYDIASNYAAAALVQHHAIFHPEGNVIDLHFLRVPEAEISLDLFIDNRLQKMRLAPKPKPLVLHIITGRGKHSPGRPRVKPAIMKRLKARGLTYRQQNPGLLEARLNPTHLLTEELRNA